MANPEDLDWLAEILGDASISGGQAVDTNDVEIDNSPEFKELCEACRRGDLVAVRKSIENGVNINAMDRWNYQPLALASLCGHIDVVRLLLEAGAISGRDTFQGERALISALTDEIRRLLSRYQYTKMVDPYQPLARHIVSLLAPDSLGTKDFVAAVPQTPGQIDGPQVLFNLHKFLLAARAPSLEERWQKGLDPVVLPTLAAKEFALAVKFLYIGEINTVFDADGLAKAADDLGMARLRYFAEQAGAERANALRLEVPAAQSELRSWFEKNVLAGAIEVPLSEAESFQLDNKNYADVILRIDEDDEDVPIPTDGSEKRKPGVVFFPVHKAMLRSDYFTLMFSSGFAETYEKLPIITMDCSRACLEVALLFFYTEDVEIPIEIALDFLYVADMLQAEKLFHACVTQITRVGEDEDVPYDAKDLLEAAWQFGDRDLELHAAKWFAAHLERYLEDEEFAELVSESARKIKNREETDTIELIDDIRYYLDRMYNMRMDDFSAVMMSGFNESEKPEAKLAALAEEDEEEEGTGVPGTKEDMRRASVSSEETQNEVDAQYEATLMADEIDWDKIDISAIDPFDVGTIQAVQYNKLLAGIDRLLDCLSLEA